MGRGHTVLIDDFRALCVDGKALKELDAGKGHAQGLQRFRRTLTTPDGGKLDLTASIAATRAALAALRSLIDAAPTS
jgi:hypothetical protein